MKAYRFAEQAQEVLVCAQIPPEAIVATVCFENLLKKLPSWIPIPKAPEECCRTGKDYAVDWAEKLRSAIDPKTFLGVRRRKWLKNHAEECLQLALVVLGEETDPGPVEGMKHVATDLALYFFRWPLRRSTRVADSLGSNLMPTMEECEKLIAEAWDGFALEFPKVQDEGSVQELTDLLGSRLKVST